MSRWRLARITGAVLVLAGVALGVAGAIGEAAPPGEAEPPDREP
ncbi:hypothetical protein [Micromonospora coerulea]|nr:hypothetical protein [Micromonospora veneta]